MTFAISTLKQPSFITKRDTKKTRFYASLINFHSLTAPIFWQSDRKELSLPSDFRFQFKRRDGLMRERERRGDEAFRACVRFLGKVKKRHGRSGRHDEFFLQRIFCAAGKTSYFRVDRVHHASCLAQRTRVELLFYIDMKYSKQPLTLERQIAGQ